MILIDIFVFQDPQLLLGIESGSTLVLLTDPVDTQTNLLDERYLAAHFGNMFNVRHFALKLNLFMSCHNCHPGSILQYHCNSQQLTFNN